MDGELEMTARPPAAGWSGGKAALFAGILGGVLVLDVITKAAVQRMLREYQQVPLIGEYVRLTYIHNPGAAFGIQVGAYSREIFLVLSLVALGALLVMYWYTPRDDRSRLGAIALICAGALGNLVDRVRLEKGVVDFLDIGVGSVRWPVFNVADIAVTTGAVVLALSLWNEERRASGGQ